MISRIFKSWKTTVVGLAIIAFTLALVWFEKATLSDVGLFWGVALVLLFVNDPKKKDE